MTYAKDSNLAPLLDRPIAFHRCFVTLTGSINAALMLGQAVYWQLRVKRRGNDWYKTQKGWTEETGLSRREQETARRNLRRHSWWHEKRRSAPARIFFRIDLDGLFNALIAIPRNSHSSSRSRAPKDGEGTRSQHARTGQSNTETNQINKQRTNNSPTGHAHIRELQSQLKGKSHAA